jgi:hypothetical protein
MKTSYNSEEWIEKFQDGTLNARELLEFEEKRSNDPEFARLLKEQLWMKDAWIKAHKLEKTRLEVSKAIQHEKSHRRRLFVLYAAAASVLIMISIPAFFIINGDFKSQVPGISETSTSDSLQEITGTPQYKNAEEKASVGTADTIRLIAPINNQLFSRSDSLVFRWYPALKDSTSIVIQNSKSKEPIFKEKVAKGIDQFVLDRGFLPPGAYKWFLQGNVSEGNFTINP